MSSITKIYKLKFKEALNPYGFRASGSTFYRVINDVVQALRLEKYGQSCTIEFGMWPVADGAVDFSYWRGRNLAEWRKGKLKRWYWQFIPSTIIHTNRDGELETIVFNDGNFEDIVDDMLSVFLLNIMPVFEKATNFKLAFDEVKKLDLFMYGEKSAEIFDNRRYWWYIILGDYERAIRGIEFVIQEIQSNSDIKNFTRLNQIADAEKRLHHYKLKHELASKDYEQTKLDILARDDVDAEFKEQLVTDDELIKPYETLTYIRRQIRNSEKELKQVEDVNSSSSKELEEIEVIHVEKEKKLQEKVDQMRKEIELLSIPDVEYFTRIIAKDEAEARECLSNPSKYKQKQ